MAAHYKSMQGLDQGSKDQLKCGICGQLTDSVLNFLQHKTTHVDRGVARGCEICELAFSRQTALCEHYRRKHSIFFKTVPSNTAVNVKKEKKQLKKKTKVKRERENSTAEINVPLTEIANQHTTTTTVDLPNGVKLDVVVENNEYDAAIPNDPGTKNLSEDLKLPGGTLVTGANTKGLLHSNATGLSDDGALFGGTYLNASAATTSSAVLTGSVSFTDSSSLLASSSASTRPTTFTTASTSLIGSPVFTGSPTLAGSTSMDSPALLHNITSVGSSTSFVNLYQPQNTQSKVLCETNEGTHMISQKVSQNDCEIENLTCGTKYIIVRGLGKQISGDITGSHLHVTDEGLDKKESEQVVTLPEKETFVDDKAEAFHGNDNAVFIEVDSVTDSSVVAVENDSFVDNNESVRNQEFESKNLGVAVNEAKSRKGNRGSNSENLKQGRVHIAGIFKRKNKLIPVAGRIPQELDMQDFYFLNIVTKSGTNKKNMHAGKDQFKCLFCTTVTKWRGNMCRHMREVHEDLLESGETLIMPLQMDGKDGKVMKMTEYIQMEMSEKPSKRMRGVESQDLPGDFPCEQCGKVFNRLRYLRIHSQQHKLNKDLLCALCSKTFKTKNNLNQHLKTHEEREPYKCPDCDFKSAVNIAIHKHRQIHNANSLICDICGQAYSDKSTLKKHKQVHDPSRPWGCTIPGCTWRFRTQVMCDAHIQGHGSKRTFKCDLCGYAFRQKHHLHRHEKVVHNIVHEPNPSYRPYYNNTDSDFNKNQFENISSEDRNEMEVSEGVNLIINEGNMSNVITADHFDFESALQNGQLVIAADDGTINYEMADISSNVVYQTFLPDGEVQQFETQTVSISQSDTGEIAYGGVETIQSEVEIEQS